LGATSLVLGMIGAIFAVVPYFAVSQAAGVLFGAIALLVGRVGRRRARTAGQKTGMATAGMAVGGLAIVLSLVAYTSFVVLYRRIGAEFEGGAKLGGAEFNRAMKQAVDRARQAADTAGGGAQKRPR
jgi:hypothetical protein